MSKFKKRVNRLVAQYNYATSALGNDEETEFNKLADEIELLAADTYAHDTVDGWCCACEADKAFMYSTLESEGWTPPRKVTT